MKREDARLVLDRVGVLRFRDAARFGRDLPALERAHRLRIVFTTRQVLRQELSRADSLLLEEAAKMDARLIGGRPE